MISDPAQLQLLEHLLRLVLHGILLSIGVASVCLLGLCVAELGLPGRRPLVVEGRKRRTSGHAMPNVGSGEPGGFVIQHPLPIGDLARTGAIRWRTASCPRATRSTASGPARRSWKRCTGGTAIPRRPAEGSDGRCGTDR